MKIATRRSMPQFFSRNFLKKFLPQNFRSGNSQLEGHNLGGPFYILWCEVWRIVLGEPLIGPPWCREAPVSRSAWSRCRISTLVILLLSHFACFFFCACFFFACFSLVFAGVIFVFSAVVRTRGAELWFFFHFLSEGLAFFPNSRAHKGGEVTGEYGRI